MCSNENVTPHSEYSHSFWAHVELSQKADPSWATKKALLNSVIQPHTDCVLWQ